MFQSANQPAAIPFSAGSARLVRCDELRGTEAWRQAFAGHCKDHRYYEVVHDTLRGDFDHHFLVLEDREGRIRAIQPFFLVDQDIFAANRLRPIVDALRGRFRRFGKMRILMVGCSAGEGQLGSVVPADAPWVSEALHHALDAWARRFGASLVLLKDFPMECRSSLAPFSTNGYVRIASMPMTRLSLEGFGSFEEFMRLRLSRVTRKSLRRKFRRLAGCGGVELEVVTDVSPWLNEVHALYLNVYERSELKFQKLTPAFLAELGKRMPDRVRYFLWRREGRIVAFSLCLVHDGSIHDEYLGLDYAVALDLNLYFSTIRDIIDWALAHGVKSYYSTPLNYDPKLHLGFELEPLDLYVTHTSRVINSVFRHVARFLQPTRSEPILRRFANADEL